MRIELEGVEDAVKKETGYAIVVEGKYRIPITQREYEIAARPDKNVLNMRDAGIKINKEKISWLEYPVENLAPAQSPKPEPAKPSPDIVNEGGRSDLSKFEGPCPKCGSEMEFRFLSTAKGDRYARQCVDNNCKYRTHNIASRDVATLVDDISKLNPIEPK